MESKKAPKRNKKNNQDTHCVLKSFTLTTEVKSTYMKHTSMMNKEPAYLCSITSIIEELLCKKITYGLHQNPSNKAKS